MRALTETCVHYLIPALTSHLSTSLNWVTAPASQTRHPKHLRHIPVHPSDWHLLGIRWQGKVYLDRALPFGLISAPKIFLAVADALLWIMLNLGVCSSIHYLDDFLFFGRPDRMQCDRDLAIALNTCSEMGFPVAWHKLEGLSTRIQFLGLELDSIMGSSCSPLRSCVAFKHRFAGGSVVGRARKESCCLLSVLSTTWQQW